MLDRAQVGRTTRRVQPARRFVEQQQVAMSSECLRQVDALLLTARQIAQGHVGQVGDLHRVHRFGNGGFILCRRPGEASAMIEAGHAHHIDRPQGQRQRIAMELAHVGDRSTGLARSTTEHLHDPTERFQQTGERLQQRGLARSVRTHQCDGSATAQERVDTVEDTVLAVPHREASRDDDRTHATLLVTNEVAINTTKKITTDTRTTVAPAAHP